MTTEASNLQQEHRDPMLRPPPPVSARNLMIVIDRDKAHLFSIRMKAGRPQQVMHYYASGPSPGLRFRLAPPMGGSGITLHGGLVDALHTARTIVVVGHGPHAADAVAGLLAELRAGHPDLSERVCAATPLITESPTELRLLELARSVFATEHTGHTE